MTLAPGLALTLAPALALALAPALMLPTCVLGSLRARFLYAQMPADGSTWKVSMALHTCMWCARGWLLHICTDWLVRYL